MQVILLEKVVNLGGLGDVVKVKDGYARNYLLPQGKAKRATPESLAEFEKKRAELEHSFKFNDAVLRHLIMKMDRAWTTPSPMMKEEKAKSVLGPGEAPRGEAPRSEAAKPAELKPAEPASA